MKKLISAIAAAAVMTAHAEPVGLVRVIGHIFTAATGLKTLVEVWDWVVQRWINPPLKASELWLCTSCTFSQPDSPATSDDHALGDAFIKAAFPGKQWQVNQGAIVCDGDACFTFKFDGIANFYAVGDSFADPKVGHANPGGMIAPPTPAPRLGYGGGGGSFTPSTGWSNMFYTPGGPRTGTVTVICCDTVGPADSLEPPSTSFGQ